MVTGLWVTYRINLQPHRQMHVRISFVVNIRGSASSKESVNDGIILCMLHDYTRPTMEAEEYVRTWPRADAFI